MLISLASANKTIPLVCAIVPIDDRPSAKLLHPFVQKIHKKDKKVGHLTPDTLHVICEVRHVTHGEV